MGSVNGARQTLNLNSTTFRRLGTSRPRHLRTIAEGRQRAKPPSELGTDTFVNVYWLRGRLGLKSPIKPVAEEQDPHMASIR